MSWELIDDDLVGTTSARLLAAGVSRRDRLDALSLLGLLGDHADHEGLVRVPLSTLAGEFSMPSERAHRLLGTLVDVGAVATTDRGLVVAAWQPSAAGGLRLAGFLAHVATVLDEAGSSGDEGATATTAGQARRVPRGDIGGRGRPAREPLVAALITIAAVLLATVAPSSGSLTALRTVTSSPDVPVLTDRGVGPGRVAPTPVDAAPAPALPPASLDEGGDAALGDRAGGATPLEGSPAVAPTDAVLPPTPAAGSPGASAPELPSTGDGRGQAPVASEPPLSRFPSNVAPAPAPGTARRGGPLPASPSEDAVRAEPGPVPVVCPVTRAPYPVVQSTTVRSAPLDVVTASGRPTVIEVVGMLVNPSDAAVVVGLLEIELDLGQGRIAVAASPTPRPVGARGTEGWRVSVTAPSGAAEGEHQVAGARVARWSWLEDEVARACPS